MPYPGISSFVSSLARMACIGLDNGIMYSNRASLLLMSWVHPLSVTPLVEWEDCGMDASSSFWTRMEGGAGGRVELG